MVLDLKAFLDETLDISMADGETLRIPKPSQRMLIKIMGFREIGDDTPPEKVTEALNDMTHEVLNSNIDDIQIDMSSIIAMSDGVKLKILTAYTEFMREVQANPTMPSPASPARRGKRKGIRSFLRRFGK